MSTTKKVNAPGLTLAQLKEKLLADGKVTETDLTKARQELAADPTWQAYAASQPQAQS